MARSAQAKEATEEGASNLAIDEVNSAVERLGRIGNGATENIAARGLRDVARAVRETDAGAARHFSEGVSSSTVQGHWTGVLVVVV